MARAASVPRRRFRRLRALLALLLVFGQAATAATDVVGIGQDAAPVPLDLAAMTLVPPDLSGPSAQPDPGFALAGGGQVSLPAYIDRLAPVLGRWRRADVAALGDTLAASGWRRHYESRLTAPNEETPGRPSATVDSAVTEYADPDGAAAAFALLAAASPGAAGRPVRGLVPFGDESRITRTAVAGAEPGAPADRFALSFRSDNLVANVAIADLVGDREWGVLVLERLAAVFLVRVDAVRGAGLPGLAPRLLRLDDPGLPPPLADGYDRRAGTTFPLDGVDPDDAADREGLYGAAIDVYSYERTLPMRGTAVPAYYGVKLYRFPDALAAAAWLAEAPERLLADPGSFLSLAPLADAAVVGDDSRTLAYSFPASESVVARGHRVYARLGNAVARVQLDADPEAPLAVVEAFARAQVACLAATAACDAPPPVPLDRLVSATATTPA